MIGAGNDKQACFALCPCFRALMISQFRLLAKKILEQPDLSDDARFSTNGARVKNRDTLIQIITDVLERHTRDHWIEKFTGLGCVLSAV